LLPFHDLHAPRSRSRWNFLRHRFPWDIHDRGVVRRTGGCVERCSVRRYDGAPPPRRRRISSSQVALCAHSPLFRMVFRARGSFALAAASGVLLALSFPRYGHPAVAWIALAPLLVALG